MSIAPTEQPTQSMGAQAKRLSGLIERVTFHSGESGFCVLRIRVRGHREPVTVVGVLPQVQAGEWIEAEGRWTVNRDYVCLSSINRTTPDGRLSL